MGLMDSPWMGICQRPMRSYWPLSFFQMGRPHSSSRCTEAWGLPIWKKDNGQYERIGRWQIPIHGESIKPIAAEPARKALGEGNLYEGIAITHLLTDANDGGRIA